MFTFLCQPIVYYVIYLVYVTCLSNLLWLPDVVALSCKYLTHDYIYNASYVTLVFHLSLNQPIYWVAGHLCLSILLYLPHHVYTVKIQVLYQRLLGCPLAYLKTAPQGCCKKCYCNSSPVSPQLLINAVTTPEMLSYILTVLLLHS